MKTSGRRMSFNRFVVNRMCSAIVTVALLISLVPVTAQLALADDTDMSGEKITYYLQNDVYAGDTGFIDARIAPFNDYTADRPWAYVADSMPEGPSRAGSDLFGVHINTIGMQIGREAFGAYDGDWVALKIKVPAPGRYNAFVKIYGMKNNGIADVHIAPLTVAAQSDIPSVINPDTKIGTVDFYHDTVTLYYTAEVGYVTITAQDYAAGNGEFLLILQTRGKRAGATGHALYIGEFTLDGIEYSTATREYWFINNFYAGDAGMTDGRLEPYTEYTYSDGQILRPWAYIADSMPPGPSAGGGSLFGAYVSHMAMQIGNGAYASQGATPNEWIALKIKVPAPGKYRMTLIYYGNPFNGITDIYVAPMTPAALSDIVSVINPLTKAGGVDMYYSSSLYQTSTDFGEFAAASSDWEACDGDYLLIFKNAGKRSNSTGYVMYPRKLEISGQTGFGTSGFSIDKDEIYVDETANASVSPMTNTGTAAPAGWTVSYGSSNSDVAEVSSTGVITGKAVGTAFIYAVVTLGDITYYNTREINVVEEVVLSDFAVTKLPNKTVYRIGEQLDITGLEVTSYYSDGTSQVENVTLANITGFDSSTDNPSQTLTVTLGDKTATFNVQIVRALNSVGATGRITVDGNAAEPAWAHQIIHEIGHTSQTDNTAEFGTLWDEDNLYVYFNVNDANVINSGAGNKWDDDSVEVYIDGDFVKGAYNSHTVQYVFRYNDAAAWASSASAVNGVEHAWSDTATGYTMEIKIPWASIGGLTVEKGKNIAITVHVNDKDVNNPALELTSDNIMTYTVESAKPYADWQSSRNWAEMTLIAWENPVDEPESTGTVDIDAGGAPSGAITATVNGNSIDISNPGLLTLGDVVEMTADPEPGDGKTFLFWMDPVSKRLISNQQQVTFTIGTNTQITAVYKDAGAGHIVIFFDRNGKVLNPDSYYYDSGDEIVQPENPYSVGYIFSGWSPAVPATANGDYAFVAQYTDDPAMYTVAVENGSISPAGGEYAYNTLVTVTADGFGAGRKFAYWTKDGVIVSYSSEYSFYVWDDTEIRAVSVPADETVTAAPAIYMDEAIKVTPVNPENPGGPRRVIFASERTLPAGYTLIETGILISELNSNPDLDNCDEKAVAQSESGSGQFTARVDGLASDDSRYARAYMIYKTPEGEYKVIYSNAVIGTV